MPTSIPIWPHSLDASLTIDLRTLLAAGGHHLAHTLLALRPLLLAAIFLHPACLTLLLLLRSLLAACVPIVHPLLTPGIVLLTHLLHHLLTLLLLRSFLPLEPTPLLSLLLPLLPLTATTAPLLTRLLLSLGRGCLSFGAPTALLAFRTLRTASAAIPAAVTPAFPLAEQIAVNTYQSDHPKRRNGRDP